jgi:hypothetical protein
VSMPLPGRLAIWCRAMAADEGRRLVGHLFGRARTREARWASVACDRDTAHWYKGSSQCPKGGFVERDKNKNG